MRDVHAEKGIVNTAKRQSALFILFWCALIYIALIPTKISFACTDLPVRIAGSNPTCYSTLQAAYDTASDSSVIQSKNITFFENLNVNRGISVTLQGGFNSDYSAVTGFTEVKGTITTSAGALTAGNIRTTSTPAVVITSPAGVVIVATPLLSYSVMSGSVRVYVDNNLVSKVSGNNLDALADGTHTVRVEATDAAGTTQSAQVTFTVDAMAPTTTPAPAGGLFNTAQSVTLSSSETATIYYTTNNTTPTTASNVYVSPISLATNITTTLKYFAKDAAGNSEAVKTSVYTIDTLAPTTTPAPAGGLFNTAQSVTLSSSETAMIYYTTNNTTPTTESNVYVSPISLVTNTTTTLNYFAKDTAGNSEAVKTAVYTVHARSL